MTPKGLSLGKVILVGLPLAAALVLVACESSREGSSSGGSFGDAGTDGPTCRFQCSLDGRSVVQQCIDGTGAYAQVGDAVETCPAHLACGAGSCQEPCAAAAADRSSRGCDFYMQPPRFTKAYQQSCYAAFVVNTSNAPAELSLSLAGKPISIAKSVYTTAPGSATLTAHEGPVAPGESVVLFVSERDPALPKPNGPFGEFTEFLPCPNGITAASFADPTPDRTGIGDSFELTSNLPVSVSAIYPFGGAPSYYPSATLLLPVATWGTEHMIVNAWEPEFNRNSYAPFQPWPGSQIVASEETDVTIIPNQDINDGAGVKGTIAHRPVTYHLRKGQHLQFAQGKELTGSIVTSTKPTSSFAGHTCTRIPDQHGACDMIGQQIPSFDQWGSEYVAAGYRPRTGNPDELMPYRIVAARDGTRLDYDPGIPSGAPTELAAGELATFYARISVPFVVRTQDSEHPIYVAAYMHGGGGGPSDSPIGGANMGGNGDPEMVNVIPAGQYMNSYTFYADPTYADTSLVVIREKSGDKFSDVWLECAGNLTGFLPIGTRGKYEYARVDLAIGGKPGQAFGSSVCQNGLQRMKSEGAFTATLWGWDWFASYAYPGGQAQRKLVTTPLMPGIR